MTMAVRAGTSSDGYLVINGSDIMKYTTTVINPIGAGVIDLGTSTNYFKNIYGSGAFFSTLQTDSTAIFGGTVTPNTTNTSDLGSTTKRWRNIYTNDLHLSNGIGDYTIVEGEDELFLYNNKSKKVFKFALIEVDPSEAPAKANVDGV